jgi:hypothetical protein
MKNMGGGGLIVNYASDEDAYPERAQRVEGPLFVPDEGICPEEPAEAGDEGSLFAAQLLFSGSPIREDG